MVKSSVGERASLEKISFFFSVMVYVEGRIYGGGSFVCFKNYVVREEFCSKYKYNNIINIYWVGYVWGFNIVW